MATDTHRQVAVIKVDHAPVAHRVGAANATCRGQGVERGTTAHSTPMVYSDAGVPVLSRSHFTAGMVLLSDDYRALFTPRRASTVAEIYIGSSLRLQLCHIRKA